MYNIYHLLFVGLLMTTEIAHVAVSVNYNYKNTTRDWPKLEKCSGRKQSPINLGESISSYAAVSPFVVKQYYPNKGAVNVTVTKNGKTLIVNVPKGASITLGLESNNETFYKAHHMHFHWGRNNKEGSEHTVDGEQYPLEGHFVFYNSKFYGNLSAAVGSPAGLAVLGVMFKLGKEDNPLLEELSSTISKNQSTAVHKLTKDRNLVELFLPMNRKDFYRYEGSLTTPPCTENVLWTVFKEPVPVSAKQLQMLRKLNMKLTGTNFNYRNVQELNPSNIPGADRVLYRTFGNPNTATGLQATGTLALSCILTIVFIASGKDFF